VISVHLGARGSGSGSALGLGGSALIKFPDR